MQSEQSSHPTERGAWHARARKLAAKGLRTTEIAQRIGVTPGAVSKVLNPDRAREYNRRSEARPERRRAKRAWDHEFDRSPEGRGICAGCRGPKGIGCAKFEFCAACVHERVQKRAEVIQRLWKSGASQVEIAAEADMTVGHLQVELSRLRKAGWDLPLRRPGRRSAGQPARWADASRDKEPT